MTEMGILPHFSGVAIHDCWASYWKFSVTHAICCAHLLQELNGVMENHSQQTWAKSFRDLLLKMKKLKEKAIARDKSELSYYHLHNIEMQYDEIIQTALEENPLPEKKPGQKGRPKKGKVRALIERLQKYKGEVCLFVKDFNIDFDNNQAERDLRMIKTKTKVSGCFRTEDGIQNYLTVMSYVGIANFWLFHLHQQSMDVYQIFVLVAANISTDSIFYNGFRYIYNPFHYSNLNASKYTLFLHDLHKQNRFYLTLLTLLDHYQSTTRENVVLPFPSL
ncbi:MAG: hypothetical protein EGR23_00445 [Holdemanella biformis]|nr:hypothetical protein [Holdemanella biformis]